MNYNLDELEQDAVNVYLFERRSTMRTQLGWLLGKKGLLLITLAMLFGVQEVLGAASTTTANTKTDVLDPFALKVITIKLPTGTSNASYRSPRSPLPKMSVLSISSLKSLRKVDSNDPSKVLIFRNSPILIPFKASIQSPSQIPNGD